MIGTRGTALRVGMAWATMAVAVGIAAPSAGAAAEGTLAELAGPGSCLTEDPAGSADCAPLLGLSGTPRGRGQMGAPVFSPDGRNAYLGTQRPSTDDDGPGMLYVLSRDSDGRLTQTSGQGSCFAEDGRPPCAGPRGLSSFPRIRVSSDGRFVYAGSSGGIAVFSRDPSTGRLAQLPGRRGCLSRSGAHGCTRVPSLFYGDSLALEPGGKHLLVQNGSLVHVLRRDARTGALSWPGRPRGCMSMRPQSRCVHIPEIDDVPVYTRDGRYAFAPWDNGNGVVVFRRDASTGLLTAVGDPVCAGDSVGRGGRCGFPSGGSRSLTLSPDDRFLYMSDTVRDEVVAFSTGNPRALRALSGYFGCRRASSDSPCGDQSIGLPVYITPDGRFAYEIVGDLVLEYARDAQSGALQLLARPDGCLANAGVAGCTPMQKLRDPWRMSMAPDGRQVYIASSVGTTPPGNTLVVFGRNGP